MKNIPLVALWIVGAFLLFFGIGNLVNTGDLGSNIGFVGAGMFAGGVACCAAALAAHAVRAALPDSRPTAEQK